MLKERYDTEPTEMDTLVFDTLVPPDHDLRQVKRLIDFERWRDPVTDGYSPAMGRTGRSLPGSQGNPPGRGKRRGGNPRRAPHTALVTRLQVE
jgi:hypothetical protein